MSQKRPTAEALASLLRERAAALGFQALGFARAIELPEDAERLAGWLEAGRAGQMGYMARWAEVRRDPRHPGMLSGARTVVSLAMGYPLERPPRGLGRHIAAYARGDDYHRVLGERLRRLLAELKAASPGLSGRALVDTAPLLERAWARRAGLGFIGRNTCLIHPELGSRLVLGELVLDVELDPTPPTGGDDDPCGACRACLEACPTGALAVSAEGRELDARRCLSYWTVEAPGELPEAIAVHPNFFGCDACQLACPWNGADREVIPTSPLAPRSCYEEISLEQLAEMALEAIAALIRGTALERAGAAALRARARQLLDQASSGGGESKSGGSSG